MKLSKKFSICTICAPTEPYLQDLVHLHRFLKDWKVMDFENTYTALYNRVMKKYLKNGIHIECMHNTWFICEDCINDTLYLEHKTQTI